MKILSIDWDYFVDASAYQRATMFPDGGNENISGPIQDLIWISRYAYFEKILQFGVVKDFRKVKDLAIRHNRKNKNLPMCVSISHKDIYDFVKMFDDVEEIVNIDFHHDFYGIGSELNCGNWGNYLSREDYKIRWVRRKDSDETMEDLEVISFNEAFKQNYDAIFLCRSDVWSPPHLDVKFSELCKAFGIKEFLTPRYRSYDSETIKSWQKTKIQAKGIDNRGQEER